jgi:hypothetical protein
VLQSLLCDLAAATIYWPLARFSRVLDAAGIDVETFPLSPTDDGREGTPLEKRFRADETANMMTPPAQIRFRPTTLLVRGRISVRRIGRWIP